MEATDYTISDDMSTYLCNFVKYGNPNGEDKKLPTWSKCRNIADVMSFGDAVSVNGKVKMSKLIYNTLTTKPVGE